MEPVLAVFAGYTLTHDYVPPGAELEPYVQEALEEIEYVTGDANTTSGARNAARTVIPRRSNCATSRSATRTGSTSPAATTGGSRNFTTPSRRSIRNCRSSPPRNGPKPRGGCGGRALLQIRGGHGIAGVSCMTPATRAEKPKIFVGEWATRVGSPTPNMAGALGDAAWMAGLERNADLVLMHCYAPLFVNVSDLGAAARCNGDPTSSATTR